MLYGDLVAEGQSSSIFICIKTWKRLNFRKQPQNGTSNQGATGSISKRKTTVIPNDIAQTPSPYGPKVSALT